MTNLNNKVKRYRNVRNQRRTDMAEQDDNQTTLGIFPEMYFDTKTGIYGNPIDLNYISTSGWTEFDFEQWVDFTEQDRKSFVGEVVENYLVKTEGNFTPTLFVQIQHVD